MRFLFGFDAGSSWRDFFLSLSIKYKTMQSHAIDSVVAQVVERIP